MHQCDKKQQIMTAAERLFGSRRYHEVTLDEVAAASRVGKGTIYRYFQDKDDLFFQTATVGFEDLCGVLERQAGIEVEFRERLTAACVEITAFFQARRPLIRMMLAEDGRTISKKSRLRARWHDSRRRLLAAVAGIIDEGVAQGALRRGLSGELLAPYLLGMLRISTREMTGCDGSGGPLEMLLDLFLCGAGADGASLGKESG